MQIWVDADACPVAVKEMLFRAAEKRSVEVILVANQSMRIPNSRYIKMLQVAQGFDVADNEIVKRASANDLVITSDIPLAAEVIEKGGFVISPRGEQFTADNIKPRLTMRNFMDTMRASGIQSGGPPAYSQADKQEFANRLDRLLTKLLKP